MVILAYYSARFSVHISYSLSYCHRRLSLYGREILWPVWADILAVLSGIILIISAFIASTIYMSIILSVSGLVLCYGHCRKIFWPNLPYYFPEEKTAAQLVF